MTDRPENPELERLRRALRRRNTQRAPGQAAPLGLAEKLARALLAEGADTLACADVQDALPDYVEQEFRGVPVGQRYPELTRHLLTCSECSALHTALLDRELAPLPAPLPAPDIAALRQRWQRENLATFVIGLAEEIVGRLRRDLLADLREQADIFFDLVRRLGAGWWTQPLPGGALALTSGSLDEAGQWLAAVYVATRRLADNELHPQRSAELRQAGRLASAVRERARHAAIEVGLDAKAAEDFADEYTRLVATEGLWPTLIS